MPGSVRLPVAVRFPAPAAAHLVRERQRSGIGRKKAGEIISSASAGPGLSARNPVINVAMLHHAVSPVAGYNDMIKNKNPDPVQQFFQLDR